MYAARNRAIAERNEARVDALRQLANPSPELRAKLASAAALSSSTTVGGANVLYRTDSGMDEQPRNWDMDEFDRRLTRTASGSMAASSSSNVAAAAPAVAGQLPAGTAAPVQRAQPLGAKVNAEGQGDADWREQLWQQQRQRQRDGGWDR